MKRKIMGNIIPKCEYCKIGRLSAENTVLCPQKGIMNKDDSCNKFAYDPLKRIPEKKPSLPEYDKKDFEL